jgi:glucan phosphoethanolaminetransferase (alkaline phosphatase superfamily)
VKSREEDNLLQSNQPPGYWLWRAFKERLLSRETAVAALFTLGLLLFESLALTIPYGKYALNFERGDYLIALTAFSVITASLVLAALFFRASFTSKRSVRIAYFALFAFAIFFEYGYQNAFSRFSTIEDLRIALSDATYGQWQDSIRMYANWLALIPCVFYAALLVILRHRRSSSWKTLGIVLLVILGFYSVLAPYISGTFATISLNAFFRSTTALPWKWHAPYQGPRETLKTHSDAHPQNNLVFVVDESVRGDHLSINGHARHTTPYLEELLAQGRLLTWGVSSSGATCSASSNNLLLTGMKLSELPDLDYQIRKRPSIFQYAKAMGYRTHYLDGQRQTFWLGTSYDPQYIDDWLPVSYFAGREPYDLDALLARKIVEITDGSTGNFIWVNKRGIHPPYSDDYPDSKAEWQPALTNSELRMDLNKRTEWINSYDNAIKYNLETFIRILDSSRQRSQTFIVYTSDHGQTLGEHGERYTHCGQSPITTQPTEANVPLFLIAPVPILLDTQYRASHANIFATLLDLMNFPKSERRYLYAPSLLDAKRTDSQPRYFYVGGLDQRVFSGPVLFDR